MLIWGAFWGAVLGALWPGWDDGAWVGGLLLGLLAGWTLQRAVRSVVRKELAAAARTQTAGAPSAANAPPPIGTAPVWTDDAVAEPPPADFADTVPAGAQPALHAAPPETATAPGAAARTGHAVPTDVLEDLFGDDAQPSGQHRQRDSAGTEQTALLQYAGMDA